VTTYKGSCHCGAVAFEVEADLQAGTRKCNCSYCTKARNWFVLVSPDQFRLAGAPALTPYSFGAQSLLHLFCPTCGIHAFGRSNDQIVPPEMAWVYVNVAALDDLPAEALGRAPVTAVDGRHDAFERLIDPANTL
jgi:hypothetical protein